MTPTKNPQAVLEVKSPRETTSGRIRPTKDRSPAEHISKLCQFKLGLSNKVQLAFQLT